MGLQQIFDLFGYLLEFWYWIFYILMYLTLTNSSYLDTKN